MRAPSKQAKAKLAVAQAWKDFYSADRAAIAALFVAFDLYSAAPPGLDANAVMRREGQRDVLLWIVQQLGLRSEHFPSQAWDDTDVLDRMMGS